MSRPIELAPTARPGTPFLAREGGRGVRCSRILLVLIILAALLTPGISIRDAWPEVRVEQVLALVAGGWLAWGWWRAGRLPRPLLVDLIFFAVALSILASIAYATAVLESAFSVRDLFEVVKVGLYWVLFRFGVAVAERSGQAVARDALRTLLGGGVLAATLGVAQYYNWLDVNGWVADAWAPAHHLRTLIQDARAVGTVGNPNYFGMLAALVGLAAVAWLALGARGGDRWLSVAAVAGGALALVTSGSRGALLAFGAGLVVLWAAALVAHRVGAGPRACPASVPTVVAPATPGRARGPAPTRQLAIATTYAAVALILAVMVVQAAPRGREDYLTRLARSFGADADGSIALRLERWRSAMPWVDESAGDQAAPGTAATYIENGSLEDGNGRARAFRTLPGTRYELTEEDARYGERSARFQGNPDDPTRRAAIFQQRYLGRAGGGEPLTAAAWVKLPGPVTGDLSLWVNVYYADGGRSDPHVRVPVDTSKTGVWQQVSAPVTPEAGRFVTYVGVYVMGEDFEGEALVDGIQLVEGAQPLDFATLREVSPPAAGLDAGARLRESPVFGGGPGKAEEAGAVDNEYLTIAARYGLLGLAIYLALWAAAALAAWRGFRRVSGGAAGALCLVVTAGVAAFLVFNLVAGSFLHLQLMGLFWPLAGVAADMRDDPAVY